MLRVLRLMSAILAIAAILTWPNPALAAGGGTISGRIVNQTANGSPVSAVEVTLASYVNSNLTASQQKVTTDASGNFRFSGLSTDNGTTYTVSTTFQNASYASENITLTPANPTQTVGLDVYDSTTSDENIQVSTGHMIVYVDQGDLEVMEIWRFDNTSDKTFIGSEGKAGGSTLRFTLPAGATSLSPGPGVPIEPIGTGAVSTVAVPPGTTDVSLDYFLPYQGSSMTILRQADYPISNFSLLVQDAGVKVTSTALTQATPQMIVGSNYLYFGAANVTKGVTLDASLSGIVKPSAASPQSFLLWPWLLAGVAGLGLVLAVAVLQIKKRQMPTVSATSKGEFELLGELARLDDAYEAGMIGEKEYRVERTRVKASLLDVYAQSQES